MKCAKLKLGTKAIKAAEYTTLDGETARLGLRLTLGADLAVILQNAATFAAARGVKDPRDGNPLYELGKAVHLVAMVAVDLDAPAEPHFTGGVEQVLETLDEERIFLLQQLQLTHQADSGATPSRMGRDEFIAAVFICAQAEEGAELPFERWQPNMQRSFVRTLASQFALSPQDKSLTGTPFAATIATA